MIDLSLMGNKAIVTGARSGMGRSTALLLAEAGADLALADLVVDDGQIDSLSQQIKELGRDVFVVQADVSKKQDVDNLFEQMIKRFGRIDICVNNAGIGSADAITELSESEWDKVIDVDLKSVYLCGQLAAREMIKNKQGNIVNIASEFGLHGFPNRGAYCAAKAGVINLTRVMAIELGPYNIRVNAVAPGVIKTPLSWRRWNDPKLLQETEAEIPMGRMGEPEEVAAATLFLASDAASYITGQTLLVDGGVHA
jgi:NAD(P)-dependent dehydrogenase (short-subunit alcohol dehydrogenase family)